MIPLVVIENEPAPDVPVFSYENPVVNIDGQAGAIGALFHYALESQAVTMSANIVGQSNQGPFVAPITIPGTIGLPFVRLSNGRPLDEEVYLPAAVTDGIMTATGTLPSGAWELSGDRVNAALKKINAPFLLELPTLTFIVSRG
jgi:hypothetical protein